MALHTKEEGGEHSQVSRGTWAVEQVGLQAEIIGSSGDSSPCPCCLSAAERAPPTVALSNHKERSITRLEHCQALHPPVPRAVPGVVHVPVELALLQALLLLGRQVFDVVHAHVPLQAAAEWGMCCVR